MNQWGKVTHAFADGGWIIDVDQLWKVFYDAQRTENYLSAPYVTMVPIDTGSLGPKVFNRNINFDAAAADARASADNETATLCYDITADRYTGASLRHRVEAELGALESSRNKLTEAVQQNGRENAEHLRSNIAGWERAISVAKFVRDSSATVLAIGGTVLTGGGAAAGIGFMAAGSTLTGVGKAQDCDHKLTIEQAVGVAMVSGSLDFFTSVVSLGVGPATKGLSWGGKALVNLVIKVPTKTVTSIGIAEIERRPGDKSESLAAHAWKATQSWAIDTTAGGVMTLGPVKLLLRGIALPIATAVKSNAADLKGAVASKFIRGGAKSLVKAGETTGLDAVVKMGVDRSPLPDAVIRQPVHGGADVIKARLNAVLSPLQSM